MPFRLSSLVLAFCFLTVLPAKAQLLINPQQQLQSSSLDLQLALSFSEVEYDAGGVRDAEVERSILGAAVSLPLQENLDLYGELGYIAKAELSNSSDDGDGFLFGSGLRSVLYRQKQLSVHGRAGFRFIFEDYGNGVDGEEAEVELGAVARYDVGNQIGVYAGLELVPFSDGEFEFNDRTVDIDRDDILGFRLGLDAQIDELTLGAEVALLSEEAFMLRLGIPLD